MASHTDQDDEFDKRQERHSGHDAVLFMQDVHRVFRALLHFAL